MADPFAKFTAAATGGAAAVARPRAGQAGLPPAPTEVPADYGGLAPGAFFDQAHDAQDAALLAALVELNGAAGYDEHGLTVGYVPEDLYFHLPLGCEQEGVPAAEFTGKIIIERRRRWPAVARVNTRALKAAGIEETDAEFYGLVRGAAWGVGYQIGPAEVTTCTVTANAYTDQVTFIAQHKALTQRAVEFAVIHPMIQEVVFRTMGHHYITADRETYAEKYNRIAAACLVPALYRDLEEAMALHDILHMVNKGHIYGLVTAAAAAGRTSVPAAIAIRSTAAPAGTAIVTTSYAVLRAMGDLGVAQEVMAFGGATWADLEAVVNAIKADPAAYHKSAQVYGRGAFVASGTAPNERAYAHVAAACVTVAAILQAYIDVFHQGTDLSKAKALIKHANQRSALKASATTLFRAIRKTTPDSMQALLNYLHGGQARALQADDEME